MKKSLLARGAAVLLSVLLLTLLVLPAAAAATTAASEEAPPAVTEALTPPVTDEVTDVTPVSSLIADFLGENAASLLSGATLLLTVILTLVLQRRVLPSLLSAFSSLVGKSQRTLEALELERTEEGARIAALLTRAEEALAEATRASATAEEWSAALLARGEGERATALLLREQSALLYELLMSANLPQYQKDRIGAAYARTEALLGETSNE